jgi:Mn2+/Fe2+ NRAMP family transporter
MNLLKRIWALLLVVGPGIFCIGYTIGTGSVTSMVKAGSLFGMRLLWVLLLSCLFSWVLMEAFGRFSLVANDTAIHGFRRRLPAGPALAVIVTAGIVVAQLNSLTGILGLSSAALFEVVQVAAPSTAGHQYSGTLLIAVVVVLVMYVILLKGSYATFERLLVFFVTLMGGCFLISMAVVPPAWHEVLRGLVPQVPSNPSERLMVAAFVGTTMAAPTFVVRPLLLRGKGWTMAEYRTQQRDALVSAVTMFVISGSIMAVSTGALFHRGLTVERVLDMVNTLTPLAGPMATSLFLLGTLSAGLSSVFPILMVAPLLIADYRKGELETRTPLFRALTGLACLVGLTVPILGANPILAQILTQVANVFVLPLVIGGILILVNRRDLMGEHRAGILLNFGLGTAFLFSLLISWAGFRALQETLLG